MSETALPSPPPKKKRSWCCASCIIVPLVSILCLVSVYFLRPPIGRWLSIFGMEA